MTKFLDPDNFVNSVDSVIFVNSQFMNFLSKLFSKKISYPNIFAAKVIDIQKHPNADRLRIIKLNVGGRVVEPVVCGAFNFAAGDMVALALPGAQIAQNIHTDDHNPFILQKAAIRGIESQGMICAAFELGIGPLSDKPEILLLKPWTKPGNPFSAEMVE